MDTEGGSRVEHGDEGRDTNEPGDDGILVEFGDAEVEQCRCERRSCCWLLRNCGTLIISWSKIKE